MPAPKLFRAGTKFLGLDRFGALRGTVCLATHEDDSIALQRGEPSTSRRNLSSERKRSLSLSGNNWTAVAALEHFSWDCSDNINTFLIVHVNNKLRECDTSASLIK